MKKYFALPILLALGASALAATVTVTGPIVKRVPKEKEIYVEQDGKRHEFYFKEDTTVSRDGKPASYDDLEDGMKVEVTAEKKGKRLEPKTVKILE